jgi:methyl-accepting chemotaxis protein
MSKSFDEIHQSINEMSESIDKMNESFDRMNKSMDRIIESTRLIRDYSNLKIKRIEARENFCESQF